MKENLQKDTKEDKKQQKHRNRHENTIPKTPTLSTPRKSMPNSPASPEKYADTYTNTQKQEKKTIT